MRIQQFFVPLGLAFSLSGCDFLGEDLKAKQEQEWLAQHQQLNAAVKLIREQGLDTVVATAEAGSVAACVASKLAADPVGQLVTVEGALVETAKITQLVADVQQLLEQEIDLMQVSNLLKQGAELATYASTLLTQQGLEQALATLKQMALESQGIAQENLGGHLQKVMESCEIAAPESAPETAPTPEAEAEVIKA
jgi:hydroxymethylpyrimidine pyrophosphatase-like HAD family hydrolase